MSTRWAAQENADKLKSLFSSQVTYRSAALLGKQMNLREGAFLYVAFDDWANWLPFSGVKSTLANPFNKRQLTENVNGRFELDVTTASGSCMKLFGEDNVPKDPINIFQDIPFAVCFEKHVRQPVYGSSAQRHDKLYVPGIPCYRISDCAARLSSHCGEVTGLLYSHIYAYSSVCVVSIPHTHVASLDQYPGFVLPGTNARTVLEKTKLDFDQLIDANDSSDMKPVNLDNILRFAYFTEKSTGSKAFKILEILFQTWHEILSSESWTQKFREEKVKSLFVKIMKGELITKLDLMLAGIIGKDHLLPAMAQAENIPNIMQALGGEEGSLYTSLKSLMTDLGNETSADERTAFIHCIRRDDANKTVLIVMKKHSSKEPEVVYYRFKNNVPRDLDDDHTGMFDWSAKAAKKANNTSRKAEAEQMLKQYEAARTTAEKYYKWLPPLDLPDTFKNEKKEADSLDTLWMDSTDGKWAFGEKKDHSFSPTDIPKRCLSKNHKSENAVRASAGSTVDSSVRSGSNTEEL